MSFRNTSTTLISDFGQPISGAAGAYYFGLVIAPLGTTDPAAFMFTGVYATNLPIPGRLNGGVMATVPGWQAGQTRSFMVVGWRAALGPNFHPEWLLPDTYWQGVGWSVIATGAAGGVDDTGVNFPALSLFGPLTISSGFDVGGCLGGFGGFIVQPTNQTVAVGAPVQMWAAGMGCGYNLPWYFNGNPVSVTQIANKSCHSIASAQLTDSGDYYVVAEYFGHRTPSAHALLTVVAPPVVRSQPQTQTAVVGSNVQFRVFSGGTPPFSCQWFKDANPITTAQTNASLLLPAVAPAQSGAYSVVISNFAGSVTSAPASLSVIDAVDLSMVPWLAVTAPPGTLATVEYSPAIELPGWTAFPPFSVTASPQFFFDASSPLQAQRFYRAAAPGAAPALDLHVVPGITLTGSVGGSVRVDYINQFGPTNAWVPLATVTLTNTSQPFYDTAAPGAAPRLYRLLNL